MVKFVTSHNIDDLIFASKCCDTMLYIQNHGFDKHFIFFTTKNVNLQFEHLSFKVFMYDSMIRLDKNLKNYLDHMSYYSHRYIRDRALEMSFINLCGATCTLSLEDLICHENDEVSNAALMQLDDLVKLFRV